MAGSDCVSTQKSQTELHPYSIASGVNDEHLRFLIKRFDNGNVSVYLSELNPGDRLTLSPPFGWFRPGQSDNARVQPVFIATGTGIAPFISYMHSF